MSRTGVPRFCHEILDASGGPNRSRGNERDALCDLMEALPRPEWLEKKSILCNARGNGPLRLQAAMLFQLRL